MPHSGKHLLHVLRKSEKHARVDLSTEASDLALSNGNKTCVRIAKAADHFGSLNSDAGLPFLVMNS